MIAEGQTKAVAKVKGLVMAGGFSRRMGRDKALLCYHDVPQVLWTYRLLQQSCNEVWIGCRPGQDIGSANDLPRIHDRETGRGPAEGIAAALAHDPSSAWLAVACDLPRLSPGVFRDLLLARDSQALATAYCSAHDGQPEPLCAIYEPEIQPLIEAALLRGRNCPRKILLEAEERVRLLPPRSDGALDNFNTPEEAAALRADSPNCQK